jgi:hypothetical protein
MEASGIWEGMSCCVGAAARSAGHEARGMGRGVRGKVHTVFAAIICHMPTLSLALRLRAATTACCPMATRTVAPCAAAPCAADPRAAVPRAAALHAAALRAAAPRAAALRAVVPHAVAIAPRAAAPGHVRGATCRCPARRSEPRFKFCRRGDALILQA